MSVPVFLSVKVIDKREIFKYNNILVYYIEKGNKITKMKKIIMSLVALTLTVTLLFGINNPTAQTPEDMTVKELEDKLAQAEKAREAAQSEVNKANNSKSDAVAAKEAADKKIAALHTEMAALEELIAEYEMQIADCQVRIGDEQSYFDSRFELLKTRIRVNHESGGINKLALILEAGSINELLTQSDRFNSMLDYDYALMNDCTNSMILLNNSKTELENAKAGVEEKKAALLVREAELQNDLAAAEKIIKDAEADIENNKALIEKYEAEEARCEEERKKKLEEIEKKNKQAYVGGEFMWPLENSNMKVSCGFGWRTHPITGLPQHHNGVDIPAPYGSPIFAVNSGKVVEVSSNYADGSYVTISHGGGISSFYSHLSVCAVSVGDTVARGQTIAYVGQSGYATGPHLNLNVYQNGSPVDPLSYFAGIGYSMY